MDALTLKLMLQDLILAAKDDNEYSDEYNHGWECALSNIACQINALQQGCEYPCCLV